MLTALGSKIESPEVLLGWFIKPVGKRPKMDEELIKQLKKVVVASHARK